MSDDHCETCAELRRAIDLVRSLGVHVVERGDLPGSWVATNQRAVDAEAERDAALAQVAALRGHIEQIALEAEVADLSRWNAPLAQLEGAIEDAHAALATHPEGSGQRATLPVDDAAEARIERLLAEKRAACVCCDGTGVFRFYRNYQVVSEPCPNGCTGRSGVGR